MKSLASVFVILGLVACTAKPKPLTPAFFCWETTLDIPDTDRMLMDSLGSKRLYIKILDIGLNSSSNEIVPYSRTQIPDTLSFKGLAVTPVIFLTNEVFQNITPEKTEWLASKITTALPGFRAPGRHGAPADEVLFDCDWTSSTRDAFFNFLEKMRERLPSGTRISATIRLHQYKFPQQTGVPPADRGLLMFYNTGDVDEESDHNSIFYPDDAMKYLVGAPEEYPLPLDLALPLFSWGLVFREGELWKIIPGPLPLDEMRRSNKYREQIPAYPFQAGLWEVKEGTFLGGHYLRPGDHLRVSAISPELLLKAASLAQNLDLAPDASLAFFHLGIARPEHFSAQLLDNVCKTVRK